MTYTERPADGTARDTVDQYDPDVFPRRLLTALLAFRDGNFSVRLPSGLSDLDGKIADAFNDIATISDRRAQDVSRVSRMVGKEGRVKERLSMVGMVGARAEETAAVNTLIDDLVWPTIEVTRSVGAVAKGDLSQSMSLEVNGRPLEGEFLHSAKLVNSMIDQLSVFTAEVTRVAREVGTEGKLGGQAEVPGVAGTWKALTDNVNSMASNLTAQVRNIAEVTTAVARGDLSRKITVNVQGEILELKNTINTMVDQLNAFASEVTRVAREVGTEGKLGGQAEVPGVDGTWKALTDNVNSMASNLTGQVRNIADIATAIARGDLSRKITVDVKGEILQLKNTINTMVDRLNAFAAEVTRVAREVGTDGKLGGQAAVPGVAGTWEDLTDSVNVMAANLTNQVRGIVRVVTAVAMGDLRQKLTVEAKGEIAALAETINGMTDTLATFAEQVTNVAREVGVEGRLGGQANVPGAAGTWKDLTGNVNLLAANLTTQVRAIAEVATAVTKGDLSRSIQVETRGEVADLKDNINTMIRNLRATTESNQEQDWLKTNVAKFTRMLQGQRDLVTVGKTLLSELVPLVKAQQGAIYQMRSEGGHRELAPLASYARPADGLPSIELGVGLVGQCAIEQQRILLQDVPLNYARIGSGLGSALPTNVVVLPVLFERETKAVVELASLYPFTATHLRFLDQLTQSIGVVLNTIEASMRTESLLVQSQQLTTELQTRQTELEEKAAELALTSKYKSEFLANVSHELRTPLNAILLLGQQLADNPGGTLTPKQVEFARNIQSAGTDLLTLIADILDLSKIESGTVTVEGADVTFAALVNSLQRTFHHVAESKGLILRVETDRGLPESFVTDAKRLQQILKNLLSNAFKFTERGEIALTMRRVSEGWSADHPVLAKAPANGVVAFSVSDTGIGIATEKQKIVFEAFHQADAGTSRQYGGTGLGLAISRELAALLGGEIRLVSAPGVGSTFTLYLPLEYAGPARAPTPISHHAEISASPPPPAPVLSVARSAETVADDRAAVTPGGGEPVLLIVDDDPHYARVLLGLARDKGFKGLVADRGETALALAREYRPTAITLDLFLPDVLGWSVLSNLKLDPATRHIPVQMISVVEDRQHGLSHGAFSYLVKPVTAGDLEEALDRLKTYAEPHTKRLLVVEDSEVERAGIIALLGHDDIAITAVGSGGEALHMLFESHFDCCVVDLRLPDMSGLDLLERVQGEEKLREIPIVVFTGKHLTPEEEARLKTLSTSVVLKDVQSPERLFDETALFLHRVISDLPESKRQLVEGLYHSEAVLRNRRVLVVDDDPRNIYALTTLLESEGMSVLSATNGRSAVGVIERTPDVSAVIMDIMMPGMDGHNTIRQIRRDERFRRLPIIALTAKAMKGDRERCLHAGASDYIAKPVDAQQLLSLLRVWLHR